MMGGKREREIVKEWVCGCKYIHVRVSESESESEYIIQHGCTERQSLQMRAPQR